MDQDVVYIHNVILLSHKKNELMAFAVTEMDPETIILSEVSKTKSNHINIVYMWNLKKKKDTDELSKRDLYTFENKFMITKREVGGR